MSIMSLSHLGSDHSIKKSFPVSAANNVQGKTMKKSNHNKSISLSINIGAIPEKISKKSPNSPLSPNSLSPNGMIDLYKKKTNSPTNQSRIIEIENIYKTKKDSIFELGFSRIEGTHDNLLGSGTLNGFWDNNNIENSVLRVLPCFPEDKGGIVLSPINKIKIDEFSV